MEVAIGKKNPIGIFRAIKTTEASCVRFGNRNKLDEIDLGIDAVSVWESTKLKLNRFGNRTG